ncbi:hypothetical protein [Mucilaginibacter aquaedulcis]|uniref:hypothetical protein n=1 Tax=Mucilaginibacter aquaedulcis TaxID=1187081 RepID=UPI0025B2EB6F|nr:hypothetical protein [Mucilaginibacter aquaedulcis]MDN3550522.1 hypothetical protein [Mucilaginibacter aquaedulcis]
MIKKINLHLILISFVLVGNSAWGQTEYGDTSTQQIALNHIKDVYNTAIGEQSRLYNGPEYDVYNPVIKGNANFLDKDDFVSGSVIYDGIFYKDVPIIYDINRNLVVARLYNKFSKYILLSERLQSFDILNHHFIHVRVDSLNTNAGINDGFYDQVYKSGLEVLAKRSKSILSTSGTITLETYFSATSHSFYLKKDNNYYGIGSQNALLNILKDKKKELLQYIKANKIKFKKTPEDAIVAIATRYDELSK